MAIKCALYALTSLLMLLTTRRAKTLCFAMVPVTVGSTENVLGYLLLPSVLLSPLLLTLSHITVLTAVSKTRAKKLLTSKPPSSVNTQSPTANSCSTRWIYFIEAVTSILSSVHSSITEYSVIDCYRLGKFSEDRCRPILVTMNRPNDVSSILADRARLSNISIKPDLSPEDRKIESILLKQQRDLISSGTDRSQIKLRKESNKRKYRVVVNSISPLLSDFTPNLSPNSTSEAAPDQPSTHINTSSDPPSSQWLSRYSIHFGLCMLKYPLPLNWLSLTLPYLQIPSYAVFTFLHPALSPIMRISSTLCNLCPVPHTSFY